MKARVVVFPIRGRNWCFGLSRDSVAGAETSLPAPSWRDLWYKIDYRRKSAQENVEIVADFVADKMNRSWAGLEKAPPGTLKNKLHGFGVKLLSRVKPSEIFLKSVSEDITKVEITYPSNLNPRLVRRRLRHVAMRGSAIHRKHFYGSVSLLPLTTAFSVLPLPNIPFFWILFRTYSNWRALKGSERVLLLVSDCPNSWKSLIKQRSGEGSMDDLKSSIVSAPNPPWVLQPSKDLARLAVSADANNGIGNDTITDICKTFNLNKMDILKYRNSL